MLLAVAFVVLSVALADCAPDSQVPKVRACPIRGPWDFRVAILFNVTVLNAVIDGVTTLYYDVYVKDEIRGAPYLHLTLRSGGEMDLPCGPSMPSCKASLCAKSHFVDDNKCSMNDMCTISKAYYRDAVNFTIPSTAAHLIKEEYIHAALYIQARGRREGCVQFSFAYKYPLTDETSGDAPLEDNSTA